ncbi:hypothetical protein Pstr01_12070 [Pseudomonas straminea]|nr:hypothetical protein Pstr01_12070 [Pseudomonas straminea]
MGGLHAVKIGAALHLTTLGRQGIEQRAVKCPLANDQNTSTVRGGREHERFAMTDWTIHFNPSLLAVVKKFRVA